MSLSNLWGCCGYINIALCALHAFNNSKVYFISYLFCEFTFGSMNLSVASQCHVWLNEPFGSFTMSSPVSWYIAFNSHESIGV